jgi:transposase
MKKPRAKRVKRPKHPGEVRAWRFALRLDQDVSPLHKALDAAWALRNDLAAARAENGRAIRDAKRAGLVPPARLTKRDQEEALAERRRQDPKGAGALHSLVVKNIADRIDEGWSRFWDALKERRPNVRPPKPIKRKRYRSITYPQYGNGARLKDGRIELSMIGAFRLHDHRKVRGRIQTVTLKWAKGRWWCVLTSLIQAKDLYRPVREGAQDAGGDPGITAALTLSDGRVLDPPRALEEGLARLRREQRAMARKFEALKTRQAEESRAAKAEGREARRLPRSNRLKRQIAEVGRAHTRVTNVRDHWHKLNARRVADAYDRVAYETHSLTFMTRNPRLARVASDRALGAQKHALASALGPRLVLVPNRREGVGGNSQTCVCGASVPKTLRDRWHHCPECGVSAPRDLVSANIAELIAFGTHKLTTAPGRGPIDVEGATPRSRESATGTGVEPVRAPAETSTSRDLRSNEKNVGGFGLRRKARPVPIGPVSLEREPKPHGHKKLRKHPASAG